MTHAEEARFITLWQQGLSHDAMAQQLGCPVGTVKSRSYTLVRQGKIQPRQPGRAAPQQAAPAQQKRAPVQTPPVPQQTPRVSKRVPSRVSQEVSMEVLAPSTPPAGASDMTPLLHNILQELRALTQGLAVRVSPQTPEVSQLTPQVSERVSGGVSQGESFAPREKTERWNLHLPGDLISKIKAKAQALGVHPSELVAEVLRQWLEEA